MNNTNRHYLIKFLGMTILLFTIFVLSIGMGSADITVPQILKALFNSGDAYLDKIIFSIRLPRIIAAIVLGGALAVSGFLLQVFFGNPIAGPYVLGISSGAKLFVALTMVVYLETGRVMTSAGMVINAFAGSLMSMAVVLLLSKRVRNMSMLVVCGVMIGYICSAITEFIIAFADDSNIVNLHNWSLGSFSGISWENVYISIIFVSASLFFTFFLSKPIGAYLLGENYARNMGVNISALRVALIMLSSVLSSTVTAFAGPISFVGLAVPHIMRSLFKTSKPIVMIPACFLGGAIITLVCDCIARTAFAPVELSISAVTAIGLAPVIIYLLVKRKEAGHGTD